MRCLECKVCASKVGARDDGWVPRGVGGVVAAFGAAAATLYTHTVTQPLLASLAPAALVVNLPIHRRVPERNVRRRGHSQRRERRSENRNGDHVKRVWCRPAVERSDSDDKKQEQEQEELGPARYLCCVALLCVATTRIPRSTKASGLRTARRTHASCTGTQHLAIRNGVSRSLCVCVGGHAITAAAVLPRTHSHQNSGYYPYGTGSAWV